MSTQNNNSGVQNWGFKTHRLSLLKLAVVTANNFGFFGVLCDSRVLVLFTIPDKLCFYYLCFGRSISVLTQCYVKTRSEFGVSVLREDP